MQCTNPECRAENAAHAKHCARCGAPLTVDAAIEKKHNWAAVTGFVLGLASILFYWLGLIPILAVVFSGIGLGTFDSEKHKRKWMAGVGLALGIIYTLGYLTTYGYI